jgi:hypothetical protein
MSTLKDFVYGEAEQGSDSDDESYDQETGGAKHKTASGANGHLDDSSEEESDNDEEAARAVCTRPDHLMCCSNALSLTRFERALSSKMRRSPRRNARDERRSGGSGDEENVKKTRLTWMRKIWI